MKDGCGVPQTADETPVKDTREALKGLAGLKVMGMTVPAQYGGGGMDFVTYVLTVIEISKVLPPAGALVAVIIRNRPFFGPALPVIRLGVTGSWNRTATLILRT